MGFDVKDTQDWSCRGCGCTDTQACMTADGPCSWVEKDLCSACVSEPKAAEPLQIRIGSDCWMPLPAFPLQGEDGVPRSIFSAHMYLTAQPGEELPAMVAIPQVDLARAVYALQRANDVLVRAAAGKKPNPQNAASVLVEVRRALVHLAGEP